MTGRTKQEQQAHRARQLSVALRENLKRRKAQAKALAAERGADADPGTRAEEPHDSAGFGTDKHSS